MSPLPPKQQELAMVMPEDTPDRHVSMSNRLARSAQGLNLAEKRLVALGLAGTDSVPINRLVVAANAGWKMTVTAMEYAEAFGVDPTTAYEQMKAAAEKLFDRYVRYEVKGRRGKLDEKKFRWVSGAHYAPGEGYVELNFSPEIAPHLLGLRKHFTTYKLRQAAAFDTVYAWRLFEVLKSWQSTGLYTTTIEEFWEAMEAPPSCRKDFKALRTRVIEPAVAAIAAKAAMLVEWKPLRAGSRRVTGLEFVFSPDPQGKLDIGSDDGMACLSSDVEPMVSD
jgi:plasmid replication initiation protein